MRLIIRLLGLVVVVAVVAVLLLLMLPGDRIGRIAADQISKQTGRDVTLSGDTRVTLWPILGVSTDAFEVANADWSEAGPMFRAEQFKIGVEPQALWGGEVRITGLEATNPVIRLERAKDGRVNWELGVENVAPSGQSGDGAARSNPLALTLDRALITGGSISYTDHAKGEATTLGGLDLDLRWPDIDGAATFKASMLPLSGAGKDKVHVTGTLHKVSQFIAGTVSPVQAKVTAPGGTVNFEGRAGTAGAAAGALSAELGDPSAFLAALGAPGIEIPKEVGRAISLKTSLTVTDASRIALRDAAMTLGKNRFTGAADINLAGATPVVRAQLNAGALDVSGFAGSDSNGGAGAGGATAAGWSKSPIDASALSMLNGEFALVADSIKLGDLSLGKTRTRATLDRSRLVFNIAELRSYDGLITGEFVINNRSGLSVGGNLNASQMNIQSLLRDSMGITRLTGTAAAQLKFLGVGQNMDAIMRSLSGSGSVKTGRGVIEGFDLDKLMRAGDLTGGTTVFDSLTASFTMQGGNVQNDDLLLSLPLAQATGAGRIGLGARDLDYLFTPKLLEGDTRRGLAIPVRITGPWAKPRIVPDLEKAIDLNLKEEKKKLEVKVEKEVEKVLEKELGVTVEEGQSIEDALQKAIEEEAKKGILKLFE